MVTVSQVSQLFKIKNTHIIYIYLIIYIIIINLILLTKSLYSNKNNCDTVTTVIPIVQESDES